MLYHPRDPMIFQDAGDKIITVSDRWPCKQSCLSSFLLSVMNSTYEKWVATLSTLFASNKAGEGRERQTRDVAY